MFFLLSKVTLSRFKPKFTVQHFPTCSHLINTFVCISTNQLECVQASRWDYYKEAKLEEEKVQDEGGFCRQVTPLRLSSTYKATSLADRLGRGPWGDGGDPDQISTCPHCHLALPLFTLRWHKVTSLHHARFV